MSNSVRRRMLELLRSTPSDPSAFEEGSELDAALRARAIDSLALIDRAPRSIRQISYDRVFGQQIDGLQQLCAVAESDGLPLVVLGSAAVLPRFLPGHSIGLFRAIELWAQPHNTASLRRMLMSLGYRHLRFVGETRAVVDVALADVHRFESPGLMMAPFSRRVSVEAPGTLTDVDPTSALLIGDDDRIAGFLSRVVVHLRLSNGAALFERDFQDVWERAIASRDAGTAYATMSSADALCFHLSRFYYESAINGSSDLRDLVFGILLVRSGNVSWEVVIELCATGEAHAGVYYMLRFISALLPPPANIPMEVFASLHPRRRPLRGSRADWGWQLSRVFGCATSFPRALSEGTCEGSGATATTGKSCGWAVS